MTIREQLDSNIPREVITTRQQSGKNLSYLEGWYVIDRLNQVLGTENWSWYVTRLDILPGDKASVLCQGEIEAIIDGKTVRKSGVGFGSDKTNFNAGEMASKEAETDALKRAAMKFGRSLGLALYDKTQEFVSEQQNTQAEPKERKTSPEAQPKVSEPKRATNADSNSKSGGAKGNVSSLRAQIKSAFAVLQDLKKISKDTFVTDYLGGAKTDDLTDAKVTEVITKLKTNFPELGLN